MDQIEKNPNDKIARLENEIKVLKNEVQAVLLDLRESYLNMQNPFNVSANPATIQPIVINEQVPAREPRPAEPRQEVQKQDILEPEEELPPESEEVLLSRLDSQNMRGKVTRRSDSYIELETQSEKLPETAPRNKSKLDLVTMAGLTGWVEQSTKKIGRERTTAVFEISEVMGYVSPELKPVIAKLISLSPQCDGEQTARSRDYLDSLIKLNSLLGSENREETALLLLSLVSGDPDRG
jgi:hypothetical protein